MNRIILCFAALFFLVACSAPSTPPTVTLVPQTLTSTPTQIQATETLVPPTNTPTPESPALREEAQYKETLSAEQKAVYEKTQDRTSEGLSRKFLDGDLSNYVAYFDSTGEVISVWNFEQGRSNPALLVENNLFINQSSSSGIVLNPKLDKTSSSTTLANYFTYVRGNLCALRKGINLPNTLDGAVDEITKLGLLETQCVIYLKSSKGGQATTTPYNVPSQTLRITKDTGLVFKVVDKPLEHMILITFTDLSRSIGWNFEQDGNGPLEINFYNQGAEDLIQYKEYKDMILARRIASSVESLFWRVTHGTNGIGKIDNVTAQVIFNPEYLDNVPNPLVIFSNTR